MNVLFYKEAGKSPVRRHARSDSTYLIKHFTGLSSNLLVGAKIIEQGHCPVNWSVFRSKIVSAVHLYDENQVDAGKQSQKNGFSLD